MSAASRSGSAGLQVIPMSPVVGAEIRGVDLAHPIDDAAFAAIHRAWLDHGVLLFRDQRLTPAQEVAFSRRFGNLDMAPVDEYGRMIIPGVPEILIISNVKENGRPIGSLGAGEAIWHQDMTYNDIPAKGSALYAIEVPPAGGDTGFLNLYRACDAMPAALRARLEGKFIKHDASHNSAGGLREGYAKQADVSQYPGAIHPAFARHPETGRLAVYPGRRRNAYVMGLPVAESEALLDELWAYLDDSRFYCHHQWRVGDLLLWDNRCVLHRRDPFDDSTRRVMYRTQIQGERPTP